MTVVDFKQWERMSTEQVGDIFTTDMSLPDGVHHTGQMAIAERFIGEHGGSLRYIHGIGWHCWDGKRWSPDEDGESTRRVIATLKNALREAVDMTPADRDRTHKDVRRVEGTASGIEGVKTIAKNLEPISASHKTVDAHPELFNTGLVTINLETGARYRHRREDLITKVTDASIAVRPEPAWQEFLDRILPDLDVQAFVQRLFGYAMLGAVREHVMPIFTGTGANGKGTLRDAVLAAFGDYAVEVDPELLMEQKHSRHGTFLMELRGRRLVFCSETEKGRRFAESTMKRLVGGDPIQANRMHRDPITFDPSHTLIMMTNHLPVVSGDDPAVWRRILVVPFDVVIPPEERDPTLPERLKAESNTVLRWIYDGWLDYQKQGLNPPDAVKARTDEYRADSDVLGRFIADDCYLNPHATAGARQLYTAYCSWVTLNHEPNAMSEKDFGDALTKRGLVAKKRNTGKTWIGVGLLTRDDADE